MNLPESSHRLLEEYAVAVQIPVAWGHMDAFAHVNNTQYFRWFEDVRMTYFRACGIIALMEAEQVGPILARTDCRFILPLSYPDIVHVGTCVEDVGTDRFTMRYRVVSERHDAVAAEGTGRIVMYDYVANQKAPLPPNIRERMDDIAS